MNLQEEISKLWESVVFIENDYWILPYVPDRKIRDLIMKNSSEFDEHIDRQQMWGVGVEPVGEYLKSYKIKFKLMKNNIPDIWSIKISQENINAINIWRLRNKFSQLIFKDCFGQYMSTSGQIVLIPTYKVINDEQFEKFVLKEKLPKMKNFKENPLVDGEWKEKEILYYKLKSSISLTEWVAILSKDSAFPANWDVDKINPNDPLINNIKGKVRFDDYYYPVYKEERKLLGYNIKPGIDFNSVVNAFGGLPQVSPKYLFKKDSKTYDKAIALKVLDVWFYPIYKDDEKIISDLGSNQISVIIKHNHIWYNNQQIRPDQVQKLLSIFEQESYVDYCDQSLPVVIDPEVRFIRIGCVEENHLFSINDLKKILDTTVQPG